MKKLLSIMACVAMVLVGGLTLTACGGGKTTNASWEDYTKFVEDNKIVFEMDNYTFETQEIYKGQLDDAKSILQQNLGYQGKGSVTTTTKAAIETEVKNEEKVVTKASSTTETIKDLKTSQRTQYDEKTESSYWTEGKYYSINSKDKKIYQLKEFSDVESKFAYAQQPVKLLETTITSGFESSFDKDHKLKDNYKFTKNVNGSDVTFKSVYEGEDTNTTIAVTFNGKNIKKVTSEMIDNSNEDYTYKTTMTLKEGKVSLPKDLDKYVDMTNYGVIVTNLTSATEGANFSNNSDIKVEHLGNRIYEVTGTAKLLGEEGAKSFANEGAVKLPIQYTKDNHYVVLGINLNKGEYLKFKGSMGNDVVTDPETENTNTLYNARALKTGKEEVVITLCKKDAQNKEVVINTFTIRFNVTLETAE